MLACSYLTYCGECIANLVSNGQHLHDCYLQLNLSLIYKKKMIKTKWQPFHGLASILEAAMLDRIHATDPSEASTLFSRFIFLVPVPSLCFGSHVVRLKKWATSEHFDTPQSSRSFRMSRDQIQPLWLSLIIVQHTTYASQKDPQWIWLPLSLVSLLRSPLALVCVPLSTLSLLASNSTTTAEFSPFT